MAKQSPNGRFKVALVFIAAFLSLVLFSPEAIARRGGRRISNNDFRRSNFNSNDFLTLLLLTNPNVFNSNLNLGLLSSFDPFGQNLNNNFNNFNNFNSFNNLNARNGFNGFNRFNNFNNLNNLQNFDNNSIVSALLGSGNTGSHFGAGGAIDPSLLGSNFGGNNAFGNGLGQFNNFGNQGGLFGSNRAVNGRFFGDTASPVSSELMAAGTCGKDSVTNVCGKSSAETNSQVEQAVKTQPFDSRSAARDLDLEGIFNQQKQSLIQGLYAQGYDELTISRSASTIMNSRLIFSPEQLSGQERLHYEMACGKDNGVNNAFACPFHHLVHTSVYICGGRLQAAVLRANGDLNRAKADLVHTLAHELGHMLGPEAGSPMQNNANALVACYVQEPQNQGVKAEFFSEKTADYQAAFALAQSIEKGETFGLSTEEFLSQSLSRLCGTPKTGDHPAGNARVEEFIKIIRAEAPVAREKLGGCPDLLAGENVCTPKGRKLGES